MPASASVAAPSWIEGADLASDQSIHIERAAASRGVVAIFLSAHCPCSASHQEALRRLADEFGAKGFRFVGIHSNTDETEAEGRAHFKKERLPFPVIRDLHARLANQLGALKTPHVFLISPAGEILFQGGVDDSHVSSEAKRAFLRDALEAVSAGKSPEVKQARALGCMIKRN